MKKQKTEIIQQLNYLFQSEKSFFSQQDIRYGCYDVISNFHKSWIIRNLFGTVSLLEENSIYRNGIWLKHYLEKYVTVSSKLCFWIRDFLNIIDLKKFRNIINIYIFIFRITLIFIFRVLLVDLEMLFQILYDWVYSLNFERICAIFCFGKFLIQDIFLHISMFLISKKMSIMN